MTHRQTAYSGPPLTKSLIGGFLGTILMTLLMYYAAPLVLGQPMDVAAMLGTAFGASWAFGMTLHFIDGTLVFPALYARGAYHLLPGAPWLRGVLWGTSLWFLSEVIVMPVLGAGFFSSQAGGFAAVVVLLAAHWVYGATLGAVAGGDQAVNLGVELAARALEDRQERAA